MRDRTGQVWENDHGVVVLVIGPSREEPEAHEVVVLHDPHAWGVSAVLTRSHWAELSLMSHEAFEAGTASPIHSGNVGPRRLA